MDFQQNMQPTTQPGQSGMAAKPNPQEIMQKMALMRMLHQGQQQPPMPPQQPSMTR